MNNEIWKDIFGFEEFYQISNLGRVKSLERIVPFGIKGSVRNVKERILKPSTDDMGYFHVRLCMDNKYKLYKIHQLVAIHFLNHTPDGFNMVCDHINNNKKDNRVENIQLITHRENISKGKKRKSGNFIGATFDRGKWVSRIHIDGVYKYLGRYDNPIDAVNAYNKVLTEYLANG